MRNRITLLLLLLTITFQAQEITVTGTVVDENNIPLPGAIIKVKGITNNGTSADFDGLYSVKAVEGSILEFSYVGFKNQAVKVKKSTIVNVIMEEDNDVFYGCYFPSKEDLLKLENEKKIYSNTTLKWNGNTFQAVR